MRLVVMSDGQNIEWAFDSLMVTGDVTDAVPPVLQSFQRNTPPTSPTNADVLVFRATFNEDVTNVDTGDFAANGTTATVTAVTPVSGSVYDVTVSGGDLAGLNGTVGLDLAAGQTSPTWPPTLLPAGEPAVDETYDIDNTAPAINSFQRNTPPTSSTNADVLVFRATFSEDVTNVDTGDFVANGTTATVTAVTPVSGTVYDVTVSGGDLAGLNGTVGLDLAAGQNITDRPAMRYRRVNRQSTKRMISITPLPRSIHSNATHRRPVPPTLMCLCSAPRSSEDVTNVDTTDFAANGTTATVTAVTPVSGSVYDVTVSGGDLAGLNGTVGLDLAAGQNISDSAGNALPAGEPAVDETYDLDNTAPAINSFERNTPPTSPTNADVLVFRATFERRRHERRHG